MNNKIYIKELVISNWRNINNPIKLNFNENYNEIKGMNGLGKTSILDAIGYMLFQKNSYGTLDFNKSQYDENGEIKEKCPVIKLIVNYFNENYILETNNDNWFINGSKLNSKQKYLEFLNQILKIDLNDLYFLSKPELLLDTFLRSQKSSDKQKIREYIIHVLNSTSNKKIDIEKFEKNTSKKEQIVSIKKEKDNELKSKRKELENIRNINPTIENNHNIDDIEIKKELQNINEQISKYKNIQNKIENLDYQISDIKIKINKLEQSNYNYNNNPQNERWINIWLAILLLVLGIIPGLIYLLICLSKKNKNNEQNIYQDKSQSIELNNYYKEIDKLKNERENLSNDYFYKSSDINDLFSKKLELEQTINSNNNSREEFEYLKIKYSSIKKEIQNIEKEVENLKQQEMEINQENKEIALQTNQILENTFPELSISLFNQKENEDIEIKKNGVPFKYLNHASKQNIVFQFSEILNSSRIIPFFLIDHAESINKIHIPKNNQVIACKVSNDSVLILNGKNIY